MHTKRKVTTPPLFGEVLISYTETSERRLVDVARTEQIEVELDSFIAKRDKQRRQTEGKRAREQLWQESVRRYNARCGEQKRLERLHHHEGQAKRLSNTLGSLVAYHEAEVEKYRGG